jgi:2-succinyl-6-hydroxy-2,4-cyclohexadiene-1-carboxylate synthase
MPARSSSPSTTTFACLTRTEVPQLGVNGIELHWGRYGDGAGTALVLLHGYTGSSHDFALQVGALSEHSPVITVDQRGHGLSTKTHDVAGYSIDQLTDDLIGFIEQVADGPVDLLGHSMGGRVALGAVLARPDIVRSLILMDTSAWSFLPDDASVRTLISAYMDQFDPAQGMPSSFGLGGPEDALIEAATPPEWRQRQAELFSGLDAYAIKALGLALFNGVESVRPQLPSITMPTTVIAGSNDHPFIDQAPDLAAEVVHGHLSVIEGAYHSPQLTHPEQWRSAVRRHLAQRNA